MTARTSAFSAEDLKQRFQQINFAYNVLSTDTRRKRYDETGRTDESMFEEVNWEEWVKEFGKLDADKLDKFKAEYQSECATAEETTNTTLITQALLTWHYLLRADSEEERVDLIEAYRDSQGSLEEIFARVPCSEVLIDEDRFISIIQAAIAAGEIKALPAWKKSVSNEESRRKMRIKARKEASEAEEYAKELGVWDDLFGKGTKKSTGKGATDNRTDTRGQSKKRRATDADEEAEVEGEASSDEDEGVDEDEEDDVKPPARKGAVKPRRPDITAQSTQVSDSKGKPRAKSSHHSPSKGAKSKKAKISEDEGDLAGLEALFARRQAQRSAGFEDMVARLEAKAKAEDKISKSSRGGRAEGKGQSKAKSKSMDSDNADDAEEHDEDAFLAARARVDARKAQADSKTAIDSSKRRIKGRAK